MIRQEFIPITLQGGLNGFMRTNTIDLFFEDPDNPATHTKIYQNKEWTVVEGSVDEIMAEINKEIK